MSSYDDGYRCCRICGISTRVFETSTYRLVKYGTRSYAHPACLARKHGLTRGRSMLPEHQRDSYDIGARSLPDWELKIAHDVDAQHQTHLRGKQS